MMDDDAVVYPYHKLRIAKGTEYHTDNPNKAGPQIAMRTYHTIAGTDSTAELSYVYWQSGKYMCWARKRDIEIVEDSD